MPEVKVGDVAKYKGWNYLVKTQFQDKSFLLWLPDERDNGREIGGARGGPYSGGTVNASDLTLVRIGSLTGSPGQLSDGELAEQQRLLCCPEQGVYTEPPLSISVNNVEFLLKREDAILIRDSLNTQLQRKYCGCRRCMTRNRDV